MPENNCTRCGSTNPVDARFCGRCGSQLIPTVTDSIDQETYELPMVSFLDAIVLGFQNYFNFRGRSRRSEFWWFVLFTQLGNFIGWIPIVGWIIGMLFGLVTIVPLISVTTRRLHDIGKSGWYQLAFIFGWVLSWGIMIASLIVGAITFFSEGTVLGIVLLSVSAVGLVGAVGLTALWIIWFVRKGDQGSNKYGPDPRPAICTQCQTKLNQDIKFCTVCGMEVSLQ